MGHHSEKRKEKFYKICSKKIDAYCAKIKNAIIEKLEVKNVQSEKGTFNEIIVLGNPVQENSVQGNTVQRSAISTYNIESAGCVYTDYLVVARNTEVLENLKAGGKLKIKRNTIDEEDSDDLESFNVARAIRLIQERLDCLECDSCRGCCYSCSSSCEELEDPLEPVV